VGTTKLTRKEILTEDPVHEAIIQLVEMFRTQGRTIAIVAVGAAVLAIGGYLGIDYLQAREQQSQQQLGRGIDLYHARIDPNAADDPYAKGPEPSFRNETAKYQAAIKELSGVASKFAAGKLGVAAKYYLGLCYLRLGQNNDALRALEEVRNNSRDRTLAYLAKKVLAKYYLNAGNYKASQELLDGMIRDPQCDLPKEDLNIDLARVYQAQGKRDEALKILRKARDESAKSGFQPEVQQELSRLEGSPGAK
jgi:predicted negative regulator of RcsB-dependent stress response